MKITPVVEERILKLHSDGMNCCQIAREVGCSHMTANRIIRQAGLRATYKINRSWNAGFIGETKEPVKEYEENGLRIRVYPAGYAWGYMVERTAR